MTPACTVCGTRPAVTSIMRRLGQVPERMKHHREDQSTVVVVRLCEGCARERGLR